MRFTVKEAGSKWCPMVRMLFIREGATSTNRGPDGKPIEGSMCIGSACAMWRWDESPNHKFEDRRGYCGIAGPVVNP